MSVDTYVPLHVHSSYSIRDSILKVEDYVAKAKELKFPAVALSEHGCLSSQIKLYKECKKHNIKFIPAQEFYYAEDAENKGNNYHLMIYAKNNEGLQNLYKLSSLAFTRGFFRRARCDKKMLAEHSKGLICSTACCFNLGAQLIVKQEYDAAMVEINALRSIFGEDFYLEVHHHQIEEEYAIQEFYRNIPDIKRIAATDSHYRLKEDKEIHNIFKQLAYGSAGKGTDDGFAGTGYHILTVDEMKELFQEDEINNTLEIADKCNITIKHNDYHLPIYDFGNEYSDPYECLRDLAYKGLKRLKKDTSEEYIKKLEFELKLLHLANLESYFLIVMDYIQWCKSQNIPTGPGRGCLTGDAYVLTDIGYKQLKDIHAGQYVFTHTSLKALVRNHWRYTVNSEEDLLCIKTKWSFGDIKLTSDHKVYGRQYINKDDSGAFSIFVRNKKITYGHAIKWIEAKNIRINDLLFTPWPKHTVKHIEGITFNSKHIYIDDDICWLIGRFIGNGWFTPDYSVMFTGKVDKIDRIKDLLSNRFNVAYEETISKDLTTSNIAVKDISFFKMLFDILPINGGIGKLKYINRDSLMCMLDGIMDVMCKPVGKKASFITKKLNLALDIKEALLYLKIPSAIKIRKNKYYIKPYSLYNSLLSIKSNNPLIQEDGYYSKVTNISYCHDPYVYDIHVDSYESYLTSNFAVHNSAPASLVSYCLGISKVDPVKYKLLLSRAINKGRLLSFDFFDKE